MRGVIAWRLVGAVFALLSVGSAAWAGSPQVSGMAPFGVQRGVASEVTISGGNLGGNPRLLAPFGFTLGEAAAKGSDGGNWKVKITVAGATAVGVYPARIQTDDGVSNLFLFAVGQLAQVMEKEDNSVFELAQTFSAPAVIEGLSAANDVDYFKFSGKKGQRILVDAQCSRVGSGVDPSIRLTTAGRKFVGSADDTQGLLTDARMVAVLPEDGDYVVELSDSRYQGGGRPIYRLVVGELPMAEEVYPLGGREGETVGLELRGGTLGEMRLSVARVKGLMGMSLARLGISGGSLGLVGPMAGYDLESLPGLIVDDLPELREGEGSASVKGAVPVVFNGRIDPAGDEDRFMLAVVPGQKLRIEVEAAEAGSALDGILQVIGEKGAVLATADDTTARPKKGQQGDPGSVSPDPSLDFTVPAGLNEVTLALRDLESRGGVGFGYRITVTPAEAGFALVLGEAQVNVPKGGTASLGVTVARKGFNGPIAVKLGEVPAGLSVRPALIPEGQTLGVLTMTAVGEGSFGAGPVLLKVMGEGEGAGGPRAQGSKTVVFAQQATLPTNSLVQEGVLGAGALALPLAIEAGDGANEVAHGYGVSIPIKVVRGKDGDGALTLTLPAPALPGVSMPEAKVAEKNGEGTLTVNTAVEAPLGFLSLSPVAKGKVAGVDRVFSVPGLTIKIVKPAGAELAAGTVEVKAGTTVEVKGKVVRRGAFKEPVKVKLNGLPAGLKADEVTVAPEASEFTLKIVAEGNAAVAATGATVALVFQVNKKDYPPQTVPLAVKVLAAK